MTSDPGSSCALSFSCMSDSPHGPSVRCNRTSFPGDKAAGLWNWALTSMPCLSHCRMCECLQSAAECSYRLVFPLLHTVDRAYERMAAVLNISNMKTGLLFCSVGWISSFMLLTKDESRKKRRIVRERNICQLHAPWVRRKVIISLAMLEAGRSRFLFPMKSLDFSVELILQTASCPYGRLSL
jgi:hypothetical protein